MWQGPDKATDHRVYGPDFQKELAKPKHTAIKRQLSATADHEAASILTPMRISLNSVTGTTSRPKLYLVVIICFADGRALLAYKKPSPLHHLVKVKRTQ
jgi:hypothetical protein